MGIKNELYLADPFQIATELDISQLKPFQIFVKRFIEINITIFILIIIFPILIATSIAIKLESNGPIIFKQKRIGRHGKEFWMYKFRSMHTNAEKTLKELKNYNETNELMFKMFNDPRTTKIGKFLRKHSLDEFPQLINVIRGEMSLVGFRPPLQSEVEQYESWHYVRFASMPGLTGPWQTSGRSKIKKFDDVVNLEYEYAKNWSLIKDIEILIKTIPVVILGKDSA